MATIRDSKGYYKVSIGESPYSVTLYTVDAVSWFNSPPKALGKTTLYKGYHKLKAIKDNSLAAGVPYTYDFIACTPIIDPF